MLLTLPLMGVMPSKLLLMHSSRHCSSRILWICYIVTAYNTPTSYFLAGAILQIFTAITRIATCVTREVHSPLIQSIFVVHCNLIVL